jgi:hypothetical protein
MHSTELGGTEFKMTWRGEPVDHADFFRDLQKTDRVGVLAPDRHEGAGAATLLMAYITAFYDRYREDGSEFMAYPDHFVFQRKEPIADYGMLDISPAHKNVHVSDNAGATAAAITDRGVNILLVPDGAERENEFEALQLESARRNIRRCFAYSAGGAVNEADVSIACETDRINGYVLAVFDSLPEDEALKQQREQWAAANENPLEQSFREISLEEALRLL